MNAQQSTLFEGQLSGAEVIKEYVLAGNATITLRSQTTGVRFTFNVRKNAKVNVYYVRLLVGPDRYKEIGSLSADGEELTIRNWTNLRGTDAFQWFWNRVIRDMDLPLLEVWHEGTCGRCGRQLTVPESIARGIGPECASRIEADELMERLF
jgi:hypothetical protein